MTALPSAHSPAGASGAHRWLECPGSVPLSIDKEDRTSIYAAEGSTAHHFAAKVLEGEIEAWELEGTEHSEDGYDFVVDEEMVRGISEYVEYCEKISAALPKKHAARYVEEAFHHEKKIHKLFYGTTDFGFVDPPLIEIVDLKYGKGKPVEAERNPQLMYYALGLYHSLPPALQKKIKEVKLTVAQPRIDWHPQGTIRSWTCTIDVLLAWQDTVLKPAFDLIEKMLAQKEAIDEHLQPGDYCHWCPAKTTCPALRAAFVARVEQATSGLQPETLENWELAEILEQKEIVDAFFKMVADEDYSRQMSGQEVPGRKLVEKKSNRVFRDGAQERLHEELGDGVFSAPKLKTPPQIEKMGKEAKALVAELAYKPHTGLTSVAEDDKRPAVRRSPKDVFADVEV